MRARTFTGTLEEPWRSAAVGRKFVTPAEPASVSPDLVPPDPLKGPRVIFMGFCAVLAWVCFFVWLAVR